MLGLFRKIYNKDEKEKNLESDQLILVILNISDIISVVNITFRISSPAHLY